MKKKLWIVGVVACSVIFLLSGYMISRTYFDERKSSAVFEKVVELVKPTPKESAASGENTVEPQVTAYEKYRKALTANNDLVGWIFIDGTNINYPVMQTKNNPNYYLKHSFEKTYSNYGVPYVQEDCNIDLSDNTVIYGHHMKNGTMFSDLKKFESETFYKQHSTIRFDTLGGYGEYEIVSVFKTVAYSEQGFQYNRFVNASQVTEFDDYVTKCKGLSLYDTGVTAQYGDKLVTLSTCEYSWQDGRLVVVAKKVSQ